MPNDLKTYNQYLTEEAQKQATNGAMTVIKVRKPKEGEDVKGYTNFSEIIARKTLTEECENNE